MNPYDCKLWLEALRAKCDGVGKEPGRQEFDRILGHCQVRNFFSCHNLVYRYRFP